MTQQADSPDAGSPAAAVVVSVVRSGGIAGFTRRWAVEARQADAGPWIALVDDCPWDDDAASTPRVPRGADRFSWSVRATLPDVERRADLTETEADGAWRTLIDAVRAASAPPSSASEQ